MEAVSSSIQGVQDLLQRLLDGNGAPKADDKGGLVLSPPESEVSGSTIELSELVELDDAVPLSSPRSPAPLRRHEIGNQSILSAERQRDDDNDDERNSPLALPRLMHIVEDERDRTAKKACRLAAWAAMSAPHGAVPLEADAIKLGYCTEREAEHLFDLCVGATWAGRGC